MPLVEGVEVFDQLEVFGRDFEHPKPAVWQVGGGADLGGSDGLFDAIRFCGVGRGNRRSGRRRLRILKRGDRHLQG